MTHRILQRIVLTSALMLAALPAAGQPGEGDEEDVGVPSDAPSTDAAELKRAQAEYQAGNYQQCAAMLRELLDPASERPFRDEERIYEGRLYRASCLMGLGKQSEADAELLEAVLLKPTRDTIDPSVYHPDVVDAYIRVWVKNKAERDKAAQRIIDAQKKAAAAAAAARAAEARRVRALEALAQQETETQQNSRWLAAVPFGVGQFRNRDPVLGWTFLASEVLLLGTALTGLVLELQLHRDAVRKERQGKALDTESLNADLDTVSTLWTLSLYGFLAVTAVGITQAQIAYVPEFKQTRSRPLPPALRPPKKTTGVVVLPRLYATPGGGAVGLTGRF